MKNPRTIYIGSDHAGYEMKDEFKKHMTSKDIKFVDLGAFSADSVDYPDVAREVCEKVNEDEKSLGVLICGSGVGMSIAANKMKGIRAALCFTEEMGKLCREHNNANVLCLGSRLVPLETALKIFDAFFYTEFENVDRHTRRIGKISVMDKKLNGEKIQDNC